MSKFVKFHSVTNGTIWICPETFRVVQINSNGIINLQTSVFVKMPVAEVAERLGIILEGVNDAPEQKNADAAIEEFSKAIHRKFGICWVSGPSVTTKWLHSQWSSGKAWLKFEQCTSIPGGNADFKWTPAACSHDCLEIAKWLWSLGYREISLNEPAPDPVDPVALLIEGKMLRYERDPERDCHGPWSEVLLELTEENGMHRVLFWESPSRTCHLFSTGNFCGWNAKSNAVCRGVQLAIELGYHFGEVAS